MRACSYFDCVFLYGGGVYRLAWVVCETFRGARRNILHDLLLQVQQLLSKADVSCNECSCDSEGLLPVV